MKKRGLSLILIGLILGGTITSCESQQVKTAKLKIENETKIFLDERKDDARAIKEAEIELALAVVQTMDIIPSLRPIGEDADIKGNEIWKEAIFEKGDVMEGINPVVKEMFNSLKLEIRDHHKDNVSDVEGCRRCDEIVDIAYEKLGEFAIEYGYDLVIPEDKRDLLEDGRGLYYENPEAIKKVEGNKAEDLFTYNSIVYGNMALALGLYDEAPFLDYLEISKEQLLHFSTIGTKIAEAYGESYGEEAEVKLKENYSEDMVKAILIGIDDYVPGYVPATGEPEPSDLQATIGSGSFSYQDGNYISEISTQPVECVYLYDDIGSIVLSANLDSSGNISSIKISNEILMEEYSSFAAIMSNEDYSFEWYILEDGNDTPYNSMPVTTSVPQVNNLIKAISKALYGVS